jgi:arylsulfatase A-like enzyme
MPDRPPNILLITTDQQRHDTLGVNGNRVLQTPNLDTLAASGTNFTRAYVTCPVCIPARRTLISGLHPDTHGLWGYRDGADWDPPATLPGVLSARGYQTQLCGKLHLHPQRKRYGFDHMVLSDSGNYRPTSPNQRENDYHDWLAERGVYAKGNDHGIHGNGRNARPWHLEEYLHHTNWVTRMGVDFLDGWRDPEAPWFMHLSYTAPHPPLVPPRDYWDRYIGMDELAPTLGDWVPQLTADNATHDPVGITGPFDAEQIRRAIVGYYGLIHHIDDQVAWLLERWNEYRNPRRGEPLWILFSSDHGEMLGDHHLFRKSLGYEASAHVPLFVTGQNVDVPTGSCDALVTWEDIMPTVLDLAGAEVPNHLDGRSLVPLMRGEQEPAAFRETVYGGCLNAHANRYLVRGDLKYIRYCGTGEEQLFDLASDPREEHDLSADAARLEPMRRALDQRWGGADGFDKPPVPCENRPPRVFWPEGS